MKFGAAILMVVFLAFSAFAGARVVVPSLPEAATPDAEVSTNIALNVDATRLQTLTFSVAFDSCETNEVLVAIGADGDNDGDLSLDEAAIVFGCDCGEWYRTDLRMGTASTEGSDPSVEATNAVVIGKREFDPAWNLVKVVRRGLGEIGETVEVGEERVRFDIRIR
jgi:hypothetical protein